VLAALAERALAAVQESASTAARLQNGRPSASNGLSVPERLTIAATPIGPRARGAHDGEHLAHRAASRRHVLDHEHARAGLELEAAPQLHARVDALGEESRRAERARDLVAQITAPSAGPTTTSGRSATRRAISRAHSSARRGSARSSAHWK
jgi:hypothetical protein